VFVCKGCSLPGSHTIEKVSVGIAASLNVFARPLDAVEEDQSRPEFEKRHESEAGRVESSQICPCF
jgi:hypothetical protein